MFGTNGYMLEIYTSTNTYFNTIKNYTITIEYQDVCDSQIIKDIFYVSFYDPVASPCTWASLTSNVNLDR